MKATPASRGSGSKDCAFLPAPTAVFRIIPKKVQESGIKDFLTTESQRTQRKIKISCDEFLPSGIAR